MQTETASIGNDFLPIVLKVKDLSEKITDDEFENFCRHNPDLQIELTKEELVIMPPTERRTGIRNFSLIGYFFNWVEKDRTGVAFNSSTVFKLPNGAKRSPNLSWMSWMRNEHWNELSDEEQERFPPICPDFVVELRSHLDSLKNLQN